MSLGRKIVKLKLYFQDSTLDNSCCHDGSPSPRDSPVNMNIQLLPFNYTNTFILEWLSSYKIYHNRLLFNLPLETIDLNISNS